MNSVDRQEMPSIERLRIAPTDVAIDVSGAFDIGG
jgi:hypothetical protein